jgi:hypothetical protein
MKHGSLSQCHPTAYADGIDNGYSQAIFLNFDLKKRVGNIRRSAVAELLRLSTEFHLFFFPSMLYYSM